MNKYDSIINLPHHVSEKRPQMNRIDRAAQFAPFAALVGFDDEIEETNRLTQQKLDYDENFNQTINDELLKIKQNVKSLPKVHVKYFEPDLYKEGGSFVDFIGQVRIIDEVNKKLIFTDGFSIDIPLLSGIESVEEKD